MNYLVTGCQVRISVNINVYPAAILQQQTQAKVRITAKGLYYIHILIRLHLNSDCFIYKTKSVHKQQ